MALFFSASLVKALYSVHFADCFPERSQLWRAALHPNKPWQPSPRSPCTHICVCGSPSTASRLPSDTRLIRLLQPDPNLTMPSHFPQPPLLLPKWETGKAFIPHRGARRAQLCSWISSARWYASDTTFSSLKAGAKQKQSKSPKNPSELQSLSGKIKQPLCSYCQSPEMSFVSGKAVWFLCSHHVHCSFHPTLVNEQTPHIYSLSGETELTRTGWWGNVEGQCWWVHSDMEIFSPTSFPPWL